jgi:hexokinase
MADVPDDLLEQISYLERIFTVDQAKLKEVTTHFVKELEKGKSSAPSSGVIIANTRTGLSVEGGSIVSETMEYNHADC